MSRHRSQPARPTSPRRSPGRRQSLDVLYEDDHLLAVNKPAGVITRATRSDTRRSLHDAVLDHIRGGDEGSQRVRPINQLEARVSGVAIFAKSKRMETALESLFRGGSVKRIYCAVVEGSFPTGDRATGTVQTTPDVRTARSKRPADTPRPRPAITHYRLERQAGPFALIKLKPESHRKDQLLEHARELGHPIVGDGPARTSRPPTTRLMLHLETVSFAHPRTGEELRIVAPVPTEFEDMLGGPSEESRVEAATTSWDRVADWYGKYHGSGRSDHFLKTIHPGTLSLLGDVSGRRVLDVACGEGSFAALLAAGGASVVGLDASPELVAAARERSIERAVFLAGDAANLAEFRDEAMQSPFDAACCVMALMNIGPLAVTLAGIASKLREGAPFVAVILHPAFRSPKQTSWEWAVDTDGTQHQFRRVDAYLSEATEPITMNPGAAAQGKKPVVTYTFHRPISAYVTALASAGFVVDAMDEWASSRISEPGPRADEENRARGEIPLFLGIRARRA